MQNFVDFWIFFQFLESQGVPLNCQLEDYQLRFCQLGKLSVTFLSVKKIISYVFVS